MRDNLEEDAVEDCLPDHLTSLQDEARDVVSDLLNGAEGQVSQPESSQPIEATISVDGHCIYKSTLVSQLNGSTFLSKDRLARIKHSIEFNNHDNCM